MASRIFEATTINIGSDGCIGVAIEDCPASQAGDKEHIHEGYVEHVEYSLCASIKGHRCPYLEAIIPSNALDTKFNRDNDIQSVCKFGA